MEPKINIGNRNDLRFWSKKWNLSYEQIKSLVDISGTYKISYLENYLKTVKLLPSNK